MATLRLVEETPRSKPGDDGFWLAYLVPGGTERRVRLTLARDVAFEDAPPIRAFPSYRGQRNYPGLWWSATVGRHVGYESWLERDTAMLLDFDPQVVGFASQPFWLSWPEDGRVRSHAPDWFARLDDGTGVVVDCRPAKRMRPQDAAVFQVTERACAEVGWRYRLVHDHDPVWVSNVRWLGGYRHPRHRDPTIAAALLERLQRPRGLLEAAGEVGDPIGVLPVLYHLLWTGMVVVDLAVPLHDHTLVRLASGPTRAGAFR